MWKVSLLFLCWILAFVYGQQGPKEPSDEDIQSVLDINNLQTYSTILYQTRLYQIFYEEDKFTFFAPMNDAFGNDIFNKTFKELRQFAEYHIYPGHLQDYSLRDGLIITSMDGNKAYVNRYYNRLTKKTRIWLQGSEVMLPSLKIGNSIVYILQTSIKLPNENLLDYLHKTGGHRLLIGLLKKYKLHFQFPFGTTFLAPLDAAFDQIPHKIKVDILADDVKCRVSIITKPLSTVMIARVSAACC